MQDIHYKYYNMRLLFLFFSLLTTLHLMAEDYSIYTFTAGNEYYIYSSYYNRPLGNHSDGNSPRLVAYDKSKENDYIWQAEESGTAGYVLLKQKSTGKYMIASTTNSYSVLLTATAGTANNYQWAVRPGTQGKMVNRKSTGQRLGVDKNETGEFIGVWYDKSGDSETTQFAIFPANGKGLENSRKDYLIKDLDNVISMVQDEALNTKNPMAMRSKMKTSVAVAQAMIANPDTRLEQFEEKARNMRDSLALMISTNETNVLMAEGDMAGFGNSFSLGISNLKMNSSAFPGDSIIYVLRGKDGRGAKIVIKEDGDYVLAKDVDKMLIYKDQKLVQQMPAVYLPKITMQETEAEWTLIRKSRLSGCQLEILSTSKVVTNSGEEETDKYGNKTRTVISLSNVTMELDHAVDFHIMSEEAPLTNCKINLTHEKAWLIFDNTMPSKVASDYLKNIQINGKTAVNGENCRVVIYLNGALVMPFVNVKDIFTGYEGEQYTGTALKYGLGSQADLKKNANRIRSIRLKRGYMVTLASSANGKGYSRVYVADHKDLEVPVLPNALYGRISSIHVKKWQYVSKKGWCSTTGNSAIAAESKKVRATWFYTWSADRQSTLDNEYIPIRQHRYWPSISQIAGHEDATACLSLNEPEHSEQHNNCDCGGAINAWTACTLTPDFQQTGMRIGSPAPTDASWLTEYIQNCDNMAYRCDFVAIHCYWGPNEAANADAWKSRLTDIYNKTKRPIWITEWNYGASWTTEGWPSGYSDKMEKERAAVKSIQSMLESLPFVERYAIYNWDTYYRAMINWDDGSVTPAGKVYRDMKSDFAYNADYQFTPVWWAPSKKTPTLKVQMNDIDQKLLMDITNENGDVTDILKVQVKHGSKDWEDYYTEENRYLFDENKLSYSFPLSDFDPENDQVRVYVKRTMGDEVYSLASSFGYIQNPDIYASGSAAESWTCERSAANGFTKAESGDTYLEVWDATANGMQFNYYQDISGLQDGIYELSANVFNSSNGVQGATVNGNVVLYAEADSIRYVTRVTEDSELNLEKRLVVPGIVVQNGVMRVGIRNIGEMSARWAGGDNFKLVRKGDLPTDVHRAYVTARDSANMVLMENFVKFDAEDRSQGDASAFIVNANCQRSDNYGWKVTNDGKASDKAWDGVSGNAYWNLWKSTPFTATMQQDLEYLPEGAYSVSVLTRGSANENLTLTATVLRGGEVKVGEEAYTASISTQGKGETEVTETGYKNGWMKLQTEAVIVRPGDVLRIDYQAEAKEGSCWWSADNFGLTWQFIEARPDAILDLGQEDKMNQQKKFTYDLTGRKVSHTNAKGLYIENGKKIVR